MLNEKEIDKLKSIVKVHKDFFEDGDTETINSEEIKALEHLLSEYEKLKILEEDIKDKRIVYNDEPEFKENYISKQKIRDRVEELKDMQKEHADEIKRITRFYSIYDSYNLQINELLDLLEEE